MKKGKNLLVLVLCLMLLGIAKVNALASTITVDSNGGIEGPEFESTIVLEEEENKSVNGYNEDFVKAPEGKGFAGIEMIDKNGENLGRADAILLWGDGEDDGMHLIFHWGDLFDDVNLTFEYPQDGESTTTPESEYGYYEVEEQTNKPKITISSEHGEEISFVEWVNEDSYNEEYEYYEEPFIGTFESGKKYYARVDLYCNSYDYAFNNADSLNVYVNGEKTDVLQPVSYATFASFTLEVQVPGDTYEVIEGAEQKVVNDSEAEFEIDADYSLFEDGGKVYVDSDTEELDPKNYTSREGSTIITLTKEYVSTLEEGEHSLKVLFANERESETTFTVARNVTEEEPTTEPTEEPKEETKEETKTNEQEEEPPHTGVDASYASVLVLSILGLGGLVLSKKLN